MFMLLDIVSRLTYTDKICPMSLSIIVIVTNIKNYGNLSWLVLSRSQLIEYSLRSIV